MARVPLGTARTIAERPKAGSLADEADATHVQFHMRIASVAASRLLAQMIERKRVLILNWLFDVSSGRPPLPPGCQARLADALVSGDPDSGRGDAAHVRHGLTEVSGRIGALAATEWRERNQLVRVKERR
jgi:DNA-binding GntR family transcriptional regulator